VLLLGGWGYGYPYFYGPGVAPVWGGAPIIFWIVLALLVLMLLTNGYGRRSFWGPRDPLP
jgi:hypothetical protein